MNEEAPIEEAPIEETPIEETPNGVTDETPKTIELALVIPILALPMIEAAAKQYGWQKQVAGPKGDMIDNPQSALAKILIETINLVRNLAINRLAAERAETERQRAVSEMTEVANIWLASLGGQNNG